MIYDGATLREQLDGARLVRNSQALPVTFAWFGTHGLHGYLTNGREVTFWNIGDFDGADVPLELAERDLDEAALVPDWPDLPGLLDDGQDLANFLREAQDL